jgi:hypothetical protein
MKLMFAKKFYEGCTNDKQEFEWKNLLHHIPGRNPAQCRERFLKVLSNQNPYCCKKENIVNANVIGRMKKYSRKVPSKRKSEKKKTKQKKKIFLKKKNISKTLTCTRKRKRSKVLFTTKKRKGSNVISSARKKTKMNCKN